jgi:hypothetical protein
MAFDPVPFFVGGGALHSAEVARTLAYAVTAGAAGVAVAGDLQITQLPTPGTSVRAAAGGAVIPNLYPGGSQQSYTVRAASTTDIAVTATGSGSGRVDLVIARIDDPEYGGTIPADVTVGPYVTLAIIQNVAAGSTDIPAGLAYPAIALARLDIPASTATITTSMITPLAVVVGAVPAQVVSARRTTNSASFYLANTALLSAPSITGDGVKKFKITANFYAINNTGANDVYEVNIIDLTLGTVLAGRYIPMLAGAGNVAGQCITTVDVPAAGAHVYQITGSRLAGSGVGSLVASTTHPIEIIVEQIT